MPFGFRPFELIVVAVVALLIFGPKRLPEMGKSIGQTIQMFRKGVQDLNAPKAETPQPAIESQRSLESARLELEILERELARKKATTSAQESTQPQAEA